MPNAPRDEARGRLTAYDFAQALHKTGMRCNCDLDNWEPERNTGHSWVCRIHKETLRAMADGRVAR